jgi:hypothetical protein
LELGERLLRLGIVSEEFLSGLGGALRPHDVFGSNVSHAMIRSLVQINPLLAANPIAWAIPEERGRLVQSLKDAQVNASLMISIIKASLEAGAGLTATQDLEDLGGNLKICAFMEWLSETNRKDALSILSQSKEMLVGRDEAILDWLSGHRDAHVLPFLAASLVLDPSVDPKMLGFEFWSIASRFPLFDIETSDALRVASFLLRKGLEDSSARVAGSIAVAFSLVYDAAERSELPEEAWSIVSAVLPGSWLDWDRCDRLVKGVVRKFASSHWPVQDFLRIFASRMLLDRAVRVAKWSLGTSRYVEELCRSFKKGSLNLSEGQAYVLRYLC